jgi:hypothetical protein
LRKAGLRNVRVVGTRPLTIGVGILPAGRRIVVEHVCHFAVRGGKVSVRWAGGVLQQACR